MRGAKPEGLVPATTACDEYGRMPCAGARRTGRVEARVALVALSRARELALLLLRLLLLHHAGALLLFGLLLLR